MTPKDAACVRTDYPDHIELMFMESSTQSVDDLITHLITLNQQATADTTRIFVRSTKGVHNQPIAYLLRRLHQEQKRLTPSTPFRIAAEFYFFPLASLLEMFLRRMATSMIAFKAFPRQQESAAIKWLLLQD